MPPHPQTKTNMSNVTSDSAGRDKPRRRSRGGKGRNNQNRQNNSGGPNRNRENGGQRRDRDDRGDGRGRPRKRRPAPVQLTWWQKLLKAVGLYKEPERPKRRERDVKSNTRVAKGARGDSNSHKEPGSGPRKARDRPSGKGPRNRGRDRDDEEPAVDSARLYLGNLAYEVTESDLEELFKGIGPVRRAEIVYNRQTHRSKGYGFIDMLSVDEAKRAVEVLHDQFFMGRQLVVSGAKSQGPVESDSGADEDEVAKPIEADSSANESPGEPTSFDPTAVQSADEGPRAN